MAFVRNQQGTYRTHQDRLAYDATQPDPLQDPADGFSDNLFEKDPIDSFTEAPEGLVTEQVVIVTKDDIKGGFLDHFEDRPDVVRFTFTLDPGFGGPRGGILQLTNNLFVSNVANEAHIASTTGGTARTTGTGYNHTFTGAPRSGTDRISLTLAQVQQLDPSVLDSGTLEVSGVNPAELPTTGEPLAELDTISP